MPGSTVTEKANSFVNAETTGPGSGTHSFLTRSGSALAIFLVAFVVYYAAPMTYVLDSAYTIALSQVLLKHGTFHLDYLHIPPDRLRGESGYIYQISVVNRHPFYAYPPGSSVLSAPLVPFFKLAGLSALNPDGTYNKRGETQIQKVLAATITALAVALTFLIARIWLTAAWSWLVALAAAFATPLFSTTSRALWQHTWSVLLLTAVIYVLCRRDKRGTLTPFVLASLLSWGYFTRPIFNVSIIAISVYLLIKARSIFLPYVLTGLFWLAVFVGYSWRNFHTLLPIYYSARYQFAGTITFWPALAGHLVSPSRGFLVFSPFFLIVGYLLVRFRKNLKHQNFDLFLLALAIVIAHILIISAIPVWWAGASYGPRYITDVIPWMMLLTVFALKAAQNSGIFRQPVFVTLAVVALSFSVFTHARGAFCFETFHWTAKPIEKNVWNWKDPQFMAGLLPDAKPR